MVITKRILFGTNFESDVKETAQTIAAAGNLLGETAKLRLLESNSVSSGERWYSDRFKTVLGLFR